MTTEAELPYGSPELGSKYQGQSGPTASRSHRDFENRPANSARPLYNSNWILFCPSKGARGVQNWIQVPQSPN